MYDHMHRRHAVEFTLGEFHARYLDDKRFQRLFAEWVKSGYNKQFKPSLDRINNKKPYTTQNTYMLTWAENRYKQIMERRSRKGPVLQMLGDTVVARFKSQREAVKVTGLSQGDMSMVLNGKRHTVGGYNFVYQNPELLK